MPEAANPDNANPSPPRSINRLWRQDGADRTSGQISALATDTIGEDINERITDLL